MSRVFTSSTGQVMVIPDSSVVVNVVSQPTSLATSGAIAIVGEADEGPQWTEESKLANNVFGPGDLSRVVNKYGSGPLVDAFRGLIGASSSPQIQGSFSQAILVKPNISVAASKATADGHGTYTARLEGEPGNGIKEQISINQAEVAPSTGAFSYVPSASAASMALRVNGGALQTLSISASTSPAALAAELTSLSNINAAGGVNENIMAGLTASNNIALSVASGQNVIISLTAPALFGTAPKVGDVLNIPSGSVIAGAGNANVGWYVVTASSNTTAAASISATKVTTGAPAAVSSVALSSTPSNDLVGYSSISINNMSGMDRNILSGLVGQNAAITVASSSLTLTLSGSNVFAAMPKIGDIMYIPSGSAFQGAGNANIGWYQVTASSNFSGAASLTALRLSNGSPVAVSSTAIAATSDIQDLSPQIRGSGKALEILDNAGAVNINTIFLGLGVTTPASWISTELVSAAELIDSISLTQSNPFLTQSFNVGGNIDLLLGYAGTSATASISLSNGIKTLSTSVVGGHGGNLSVNLSKYNSINDLVTFLNLQPGYSASAGSAQAGLLNPNVVLDAVSSIGICSSIGAQPGRIKEDIYDMVVAPMGLISSTLVQYTNILNAGLPESEGPAFLSGGQRGGSSGLQFSQAIDALAGVQVNFVVTAVSQDASADILVGDTDPSSTYAIDAVNAALKSHCLNMSTAKVKRHRIGFASKNGTFEVAQAAAAQMATYRIALTFQEVNDLNSQGNIQTFQPWMAAAKAAGMQAAGFYKSIFNKSVNLSGIVNPSDFDDGVQSEMEQALLSNLLPLQTQSDGSITFVSDQTTYGVDDNFVYNSIQAVYVADLIALDLAQSLKQAFVGASEADVTPAVAVSFIKSKMAQYLNSKLTVGSKDFPAGWKSISVNITQGIMAVRVVAIESTSIYFVPIELDVEGLIASASA